MKKLKIQRFAQLDSESEVLHDAQEMIGGGLVYLECEEDNKKAYDFYIRCGFKEFDHRYSQIDQRSYTLLMKIF